VNDSLLARLGGTKLSLLGLTSHWLLVRLERAALPWRAEA